MPYRREIISEILSQKKNYVAENDISSGLGLKNDKVSETESDSSMTKGDKKEKPLDAECSNIHTPSPILQTGKKKYPQRRCVVCRQNGAPRDTRYYCRACAEVPALCKTPCFGIYHSNIVK